MTIQQLKDFWHSHFGDQNKDSTWIYMREQLQKMQRRVDEDTGDSGVKELVDQLPPDERQALLMHIAQEKDYHVIAKELQITEQVALQRLTRAYSTVRMKANI